MLMLTLLSLVSLASAEPSQEIKNRFDQVKYLQEAIRNMSRDMVRLDLIETALNDLSLTQKQFFTVNNAYRDLLISVVEFKGPKNLSDIDSWIYYHRPPSLILNDIRIELRRVSDYLNPLVAKATSINSERANALALPFDQKVKAVNATISKFRQSVTVLQQISDHVDEAVFDFETFIGRL